MERHNASLALSQNNLVDQKCSLQVLAKRLEIYVYSYFIFALSALSIGVSVQAVVSPRPSLAFLLNVVVDCCTGTPVCKRRAPDETEKFEA